MLVKHGFENYWEALAWWAITAIAATALFIVISYASSTKVLAGYYLSHSSGAYSIYIDWENAADEQAFRTYDHKLALATLQKLNDSLK